MWKLVLCSEYEKRVKRWPNKHRRELLAVHDHLDTVFNALSQGANVENIRFGFIHEEPRGIKALDQKGAGAGVKQTRLYIFPDTANQIVYLITIGDKNTQREDIRYAVQFVDGLSACEGEGNG